jgi:hypothetical protein
MRSTKFSLPGKYSLDLPAAALAPRAATLYGPDGRPARNIMAGPIGDYFLSGSAGGLGGFNEGADVVRFLTDGTPTNDLWNAYQQAVALRNAERQPLVDFLSYFVTEDVEKIYTASSSARFERSSEYGVPQSWRPSAVPQWMGFDLEWFDLGLRFTQRFLADATTAQVDAINNQALEADNILVFQMIMWTLFNNTNRTTSIETKPYTVYSFWNGTDGETPPAYRTNTFASNHTHYVTSGAASISPGNWGSAVPGDLDDMYTLLSEHGYKRSEGYNLVVMVNPAQGDAIRGFRSVQNGGTSKWDFIPAQGTPAFLIDRDKVQPEGQLRPPSTLRGMDVIGTYGEFTIVQEDYMPAGYMVAFATGGRDNVSNPIGIRQHQNESFRGLRLVLGRRED